MNPYKIVPMTLFDLDSISEQMDSDFETFWSYSMFQKELENPDNFYLVVKDENDMILGFGGVWQSVEDLSLIHILNSPPSPKILKKIANVSEGITTYQELMQICGYINEEFSISDHLSAEEYAEMTNKNNQTSLSCLLYTSRCV